MPIKQRGNSYQVAITLDKRYRKSFKTRVEAERWELEAKLRHAKGEPVDDRKRGKAKEADSITWEQLRKEVMRNRWSKQKSTSTAEINSKTIVEILGADALVKHISQRAIDDVAVMMQEENEEVSPATLNRKYSSLSVMIKYAKKRGYIPKDFDFEIPKYKEAEHRIRWITDQEEKEMIAYLKTIQSDVADIVTILINTGLRLSELWRLTVRDVTDTHLTVWESKSGKARSVPLVSKVREIFKDRKENRAPDSKLFPDWTNYRLTHYWNRGRDYLGLSNDPQYVPHVCRHTFCTRLIQRGVPITHVQRLAGHSVITTTLRYAHLSQGDLDLAILALEEGQIRAPNTPENGHDLTYIKEGGIAAKQGA